MKPVRFRSGRAFMNAAFSSSVTAPYPLLPESLALRSEACTLRLRRFGTQVEDLEVNFATARPNVVTDVLACCTLPQADRDLLWDLPVGKRIECLLCLLSLEGIEEIDADLRCSRCGLNFEISLTLNELLEVGRGANCREVRVKVGTEVRRFRRPTGRDQLNWLAQKYEDEADCATAMIASLALDDTDVPEVELESVFDEFDPLLRAPLTAACPDCGDAGEHEIDVAGIALSRLQQSQKVLLATVDLLASRYHWSESEIFAVPEWRRAHYLQMLQPEMR
jgi:DNA-directed RNA polymerase subunit RPC12/RpoP